MNTSCTHSSSVILHLAQRKLLLSVLERAKDRRVQLTLCSSLMVLFVAAAFRLPLCTDDLLTSDAADYLRASRSGVLSLYLEAESVSVIEFVHQYTDDSTGKHLWDSLYRQLDNAAIRHFHVPVSFYPHAIVTSVTSANWPHRLIPALVGMLTAVSVVIGLSTAGCRIPIGLIAGMTIAVLPQFVLTSTDFSPHSLFIFLAVLCLFASARAIRTGSCSAAVLAACLLALATATLELAPVLYVSLIFGSLMLSRFRNRSRATSRHCVLAPTVMFLLSLVVTWPGGFLKGGYLKEYGVFAAVGLLKRDQMFGPLTMPLVFSRLFSSDAVLVMCCLVALGWLLLKMPRTASHAEPFLFGLYSVVSFAANLGNRFANFTYSAEVIVFVVITIALVADHIAASSSSAWIRYGVFAGLCSIMVSQAVTGVSAVRKTMGYSTARELRKVIESVPSCIPAKSVIVVNRHQETFSTYLPQYAIEPTITPTVLNMRPTAVVPAAGYFAVIDMNGLPSPVEAMLKNNYEPVACRGSSRFGIFRSGL